MISCIARNQRISLIKLILRIAVCNHKRLYQTRKNRRRNNYMWSSWVKDWIIALAECEWSVSSVISSWKSLHVDWPKEIVTNSKIYEIVWTVAFHLWYYWLSKIYGRKVPLYSIHRNWELLRRYGTLFLKVLCKQRPNFYCFGRHLKLLILR